MAAASPYGKGLVGLLKQGWHEIPGVMGGSVMGLLGLVIIGFTSKKYLDEGRFEPKYKRDYIVYRPGDPRIDVPTREWV